MAILSKVTVGCYQMDIELDTDEMNWPEFLQRLSAWAAHGWHPGHTTELIPLLVPYLVVLLAETREWLSILVARLRSGGAA